MFLFCVTRHPIARQIHQPEVHEVPVGTWIVTAATDGWLSTFAREPGRPVVREAAPFARSIEFASASFSEPDQSVVIEKTLIGGRQVYFHLAADGAFYCASHARLLRAAGVRLEDDPQRLPELFVYRYVSPPRTLFKGIDQLLAGQRLRFERAGDAWRQARSDAYRPPQAGPVPANSHADGVYGDYGAHNHDALRRAMRDLAPG